MTIRLVRTTLRQLGTNSANPIVDTICWQICCKMQDSLRVYFSKEYSQSQFHFVDKKKDSELSLADDDRLFKQPKTRSRPSSGRRSSMNQTPDSSRSPRRKTARPESGRRSVEQPNGTLDLHEQLTRLWYDTERFHYLYVIYL